MFILQPGSTNYAARPASGKHLHTEVDTTKQDPRKYEGEKNAHGKEKQEPQVTPYRSWSLMEVQAASISSTSSVGEEIHVIITITTLHMCMILPSGHSGPPRVI